ncbi:hypothetical protein FisN_4Hh181 [Fistulifera solaris]|uniref:Multidrug resistance protein, MATE family n=1 Tax=Fistulifera solaris TaxID=1519565 RepID=A0A1Z5K907_FISSO|nr:hypothetical protein FisN_4Hh181 [Fistulifera solaris]|eukprot:GAX22707.1 hypothetical protein FisN_4Hh181 [Fistulifera solaris]
MTTPCKLAMKLSILLLLACQAGAFASAFHPESALVSIQNQRLCKTRLTSSIDDQRAAEDISRGGASGSLPRNVPPLPTFKQFRNFAVPCLALWVAGPLLSLVDTSFIGLSGSADQSAAQLAALGPATTFFDGATYLFMFLNVATTNLYSSARAQTGDKSPKTESVVRTAANVAFRSGVGLMIFLLAFSKPLLKLYVGEKAASTPGLLQSACDYVNIRALSMPTTLLLGVIQAALLGAQDSVSPLIAIVYSTICNIVGDFLLVNRFNMGLQGAAIATTVAQYAATAALIVTARRKLVRDKNLGILSKPADGAVSARTFLGFAAPVLTLILGKLAAFGFMTNSAAALPGQPTPLAVHQIILSLLFFCSPFLEVISQTAQTFLPQFLAPPLEYAEQMKKRNSSYVAEKDTSLTNWYNSAQTFSTQLLGLGFVAATVVASTASLIPAYFGHLITQDATVQQAVKPLARYLWLGTFFWAPTAVGEGVLLARRELSFLASVYLVSTALLPPALLRIKILQGDVSQVWACFAVFQIFRASCFAARIWGGPLLSRLASLFRGNGPYRASSVNGQSKANK